MKVAAIVLAAGKSERMGKNKLLMALREKSIIDLLLDALQESKISEIIIVLGNKPWEIINILRSRTNRIRKIINKKYEEGMTSSFITGLKLVNHVDAALLVLGDQPILEPKFVNIMIEQMERNKDKALIVSPIYRGKKGHPLLFSKVLFKEILSLKNNEMIRDIVHRHADSLFTIKGEKWTIMDIDTPEDFQKAKRYYRKNT